MVHKSNNFHGINHLQFLLTKKIIDFNAERVVYAVLERAKNRSQMIGLTGREGTGKTTGIASYVLTKPNSYYVNIGQSFAPGNFFDEMVDAVSKGKEKPNPNMYIKMKQLAGLLTEDESKKLIVVDDAGKLSPRGLGLFHELRDKTMHCTGFVFCGVKYFRDNLIKAMGVGKIGVAEYMRRVQMWQDVPLIDGNDINQYCLKRGLSADETKLVKQAKLETVAQLEIFVDKIIDTRKPDKK